MKKTKVLLYYIHFTDKKNHDNFQSKNKNKKLCALHIISKDNRPIFKVRKWASIDKNSVLRWDRVTLKEIKLNRVMEVHMTFENATASKITSYTDTREVVSTLLDETNSTQQ